MPWSSLVSCSRIAHIEEDPKMLIKVVLVLMLLLIIGQLFHALWLMLSAGNTQKMSVPLSRRVFFSLLVVIILLLSLAMGWLEPNPRPY